MTGRIILLHKPSHGAEEFSYQPHIAEIFRNAVQEGEHTLNQTLSTDLEGYLVFALIRTLEKKDILSMRVGEALFEAMYLHMGKQKEDALCRVGDTSLVLAGCFPERARSLHVSSQYFKDVGETAFGTLADALHDRKRTALAVLYRSIAEQFLLLIEVLKAMRRSPSMHEADYLFHLA